MPEPEQHSDRKHLLGQDPEHSPDLEQAADKNSLPEHETISLTEHEQEPVHEAESETKVTIDAIDEMPEIFAETFCDDGGNREMDTVCYPKFSSFLADARQDSFCPVN